MSKSLSWDACIFNIQSFNILFFSVAAFTYFWCEVLMFLRKQNQRCCRIFRSPPLLSVVRFTHTDLFPVSMLISSFLRQFWLNLWGITCKNTAKPAAASHGQQTHAVQHIGGGRGTKTSRCVYGQNSWRQSKWIYENSHLSSKLRRVFHIWCPWRPAPYNSITKITVWLTFVSRHPDGRFTHFPLSDAVHPTHTRRFFFFLSILNMETWSVLQIQRFMGRVMQRNIILTLALPSATLHLLLPE